MLILFLAILAGLVFYVIKKKILTAKAVINIRI